MPKYTENPLLSNKFQQTFISALEFAPIAASADILQHAADTLKEKGVDAQTSILPVKQQSVADNKLLPTMVVRYPWKGLPLASLAFAMNAHNHQRRDHATLTVPYIAHIFDVAARLLHWGITDETVLSSAVLHDSIEDTSVKAIDILMKFDEDVCAIVEQVSEGDYPPGQPKPPKWERKLAYIDKIRNAHPLIAQQVVLVSAVDKISNGWDYVNAALSGDNLNSKSRSINLKFYGELVPIYLENIQIPEIRQNIESLWNRLQSAWA